MGNLTDKYYNITRPNNPESARKLNPYEWLMIIRRLFENCGRFIEKAFKESSHDQYKVKTLDDHLGLRTERTVCSEVSEKKENNRFFLYLINVLCIFSQKIDHWEGKDNIFSETWLVITAKGELIFCELIFCKDNKKPYKQILISVSFSMDDNYRSQEFSDKIIPYLNADFVRRLIGRTLDVLESENYRREKEAREFKDAFKFYKMVQGRIDFNS